MQGNPACGTFEVQARIAQLSPLVARIARHIAAEVPPEVDADDLVACGMTALIEAVRRHDASCGKLTSYAARCIRGAMLDRLQQTATLPPLVRRRLRSVERAALRLQRRLRRTATEFEIAHEAGLSLRAYRRLLGHGGNARIVSDDAGVRTSADGRGRAERSAAPHP